MFTLVSKWLMKTDIAFMSYLLISRRNWSTMQFKLSSVTIFFEKFRTSLNKSKPIRTSLGQYRQYDFSFLLLFDASSMGLWSQLTKFWWCFPYQNWDAVRTLRPVFPIYVQKWQFIKVKTMWRFFSPIFLLVQIQLVRLIVGKL